MQTGVGVDGDAGRILEARSICKRYGAVQALDNVSASFSAGEVHGVLGENGAGKSTLMGVLSGFVRPDQGEVLFKGRAIPLGKPFECRRLGIGMIHQHFTLVPQFSVLENLALARIESLGRTLNAPALAESALKQADALGWQIDPHARVQDLPVGAQQRLEILKVLLQDAEALIFDEPTASLSPDEITDLFEVLRRLRAAGKAIVLIAHKLAEVMAVADRVTVLRRGRWVGSKPVGETNERELAEWMVGSLPEGLNKQPPPSLEPGILAEDLTVDGDKGVAVVRGVSFQIGRGEILGFGGVDGNGQLELAEALARIRPFAGKLELSGGGRIAYIPQDRQTDGLALSMSIKDNLTIGHIESPFLRRKQFALRARNLVERFDVKAGSVDDAAGSLSGGNQQKVVVARELDSQPDLLVALNPTRGLDIRASAFVHRCILEAQVRGAAIALFSTDLDELAALSSRTVFMSSGRLMDPSGAASLVGGAGED